MALRVVHGLVHRKELLDLYQGAGKSLPTWNHKMVDLVWDLLYPNVYVLYVKIGLKEQRKFSQKAYITKGIKRNEGNQFSCHVFESDLFYIFYMQNSLCNVLVFEDIYK